MKKIICIVMFILFIQGSNAIAQEPMLDRGVKELGLSGDVDFEGPSGGIDLDFSLTYGYFFKPMLEVGGFGHYIRTLDGDALSYGVGVFAEQHFNYRSDIIPYAGIKLGLQFTDVAFAEDKSSLIFSPSVGIKWFLRDYIAIDSNIFVSLASDKVYINDNELDNYDVGFLFGIRVYFK